MKSAITKHGKPSLFNFDNGSPYKNNQMSLVAARIGSTISYCMPYTPTSKGKIERWFRTLKDHWMSSLNMKDFTDLDELKKSLIKYTQSYNQTIHSSLNGLTPQDRFFSESVKIKRLSDKQIEEGFLLEIDRRVSSDNIVVIEQIEYEVDYRYARQKIKLRYSPDLSKIYIVDNNTNELMEIKLLNKHDNSVIKREKIKMIGDE